MPGIPTDNSGGGTFPYKPPIVGDAREINHLCERIIDALGDATAYSEDLLIALQNLLLGDLFGGRVPERVPIDPGKRAVTLDKAKGLEAWFRATTNWGRETAKIEADAIAHYAPTNLD